jgi:hypothetical protein
MVSSIVPPGLLEPRKTLGNNNLIFGELIGLGAQTAIGRRRIPIVFPCLTTFVEIYNDRRNTAIKECVKDMAQQLSDVYTQWVTTSWGGEFGFIDLLQAVAGSQASCLIGCSG